MPARDDARSPAATEGGTWPPPLHLPYAPYGGPPPVAKLTVYLNEAGEVCHFALDRLGDDTCAAARAAYRLGVASVAAAVPGVVRIAPRNRRRSRK